MSIAHGGIMKKLIGFLILTNVLVACQSDSDNNDNPTTPVRQAANDPDLQTGTYVSSCSERAIDGLASGLLDSKRAGLESMKVDYRFDGDTVVRRTHLYTNKACEGEAALMFEETGAFALGPADSLTNDQGRNIDLNYTALSAIIRTGDDADAANAARFCGIKDWKADVKRDISAQSASRLCYGTKLPRSIANIYRLNDGNLYFGMVTRDSIAPDKRPSKLNMALRYSK